MRRSNSVNSYFKNGKNLNKKLVNILNHKMFKGYRISKESKKVFVEKPKYIGENCWERKIFDPFDDYYLIEYKNKNLSSLNHQDFSNMIHINNLSRKSMDEYGSIRKVSVHTQKGGSFRKKRIINLEKKPIRKERYFYFYQDSQLMTKNSNENKNEILYNNIFQDNNEKKLYNDIPIFAIEKIQKISLDNIKDIKRLKYLKRKEERQNDLQFLYKLSHSKPKKIDFKNRYNNITNLKSNIVKNPIIKTKLGNSRVNSSKIGNRVKNIEIIHPITDLAFFNNSHGMNTINKEYKNENSIIQNKKLFNEIGTQSKESHLFYSSSVGNLSIKKTKLFKEKKVAKVKKKSNSFIYPIKQRFMSDKILRDQLEIKRMRFNKLRNMMEI